MKVIIVNENDEPIGLAERDEWEPGAIHRVSAVWITNSKGEILLAQRSLKKRHGPGHWGPAAAGTVEEGETYDSNILKETEEEIGLKLTLDQLTRGPKLLAGKVENRRFIQWYFAKVDVPLEVLTLQEDEVAAVQWISVEDFLRVRKERPEDFVRVVTDELLEHLLPK